MKKAFVYLVVCLIFFVLNASASLSQFSGKWINVDPNNKGIATLDILVTGAKVQVHAWGSCYPNDCDIGTVDAYVFAPDVSSDISSTANALLAIFDSGFSEDFLAIRPDGNNLKVDDYNRFTDNSGRSNFISQYSFQRSTSGQPVAPVQVSSGSSEDKF
jgi:hypothetical protein